MEKKDQQMTSVNEPIQQQIPAATQDHRQGAKQVTKQGPERSLVNVIV
jgi:hypothetical protein